MQKLLTLHGLLEMFDPKVHWGLQLLAEQARDVEDSALVVFECQQLDSPHLGERTCVLVGPGRGIASVEEALKGHLWDLPSERQYPVAVWKPTLS